MKSYTQYLDIPFKAGGRKHDGIDCFGLYWLIQREQFNKDIPDYSYDIIGHKAQQKLINDNLWQHHRQAAELTEGHGLVSCNGSHISTYIGNGQVIDARDKAGVTIRSIDQIGDYTAYELYTNN